MSTVLTTTAIISGLCALFAIILTIADKYIADYGEVNLIINDEKEYTVDGGNSLLDTLRNEKIFIPSACGGKGSCGYCKVKVLEGGGQVLATEKPWLSPEELQDNIRLSCQCKVKENIKIEIPEELFNVKEYKVTVVDIQKMTDKIKKFRFQLPEGEKISFKPGQYIQIKAPEYEGNTEEVYRAYSVASSIKDENHLEVLIGYTGGICTTYMHKFVEVGTELDLNGPYGDFYYHDDDSEIVMVAAGTGFAPIRSILYHMKDNDIKRKARFYFGARTEDDLFLLDELKMFEEELYDFKFMPTLSRVPEDSSWVGDRGRVTNSIDKYLQDSGNYTAYLCGSPVMIQSIVESLNKKNIPDDKIYFDEF
ncbi:NADH:ubiquinone reductase (Na(+)-transporting) subunit F [Miniphocaeibacter halophilus]|uniref:2Fe-2S iron-sulfur cluster binding domain-containing protein n=1 Tax=Miniphocaeibacter halophilus TaxID=2931922 RepID=A0AC61MSK9_9FIRM|nr:2Fe-2S iron-sulfur cluster binding domain-containing protein [Miniphocaeibacter halophilus]QQK08650.1 2Fe-2S iron-sulfur cluster binding domain-containing protein [Miniphocaeibacter halophilus]